MADISKIKTPDGTTYNIKDATARTGSVQTSRLVCPPVNGLSDVVISPKINDGRANRLAFLPADQVIVEQTIDGGLTWTDAGVSDSIKKGLFAETRSPIYIPLIDGHRNVLCGVRVTFTAMKYDVPTGTAETEKYSYWNENYIINPERYNSLNGMYFWVSSAEDRITAKVECASGKAPNTWVSVFNDPSFLLTGWSGSDYIPFSSTGGRTFGGSKGQTGNTWNWRVTFMSATAPGKEMSTAASKQSIMEIRGYGPNWWTAGNKYASSDHMYSWDSSQNVTFPAGVTATNFNGTVNGYSIAKSVPANAVFTDTTYDAITNAEIDALFT